MSKDRQQREAKKTKQTGKTKQVSDYKKNGGNVITVPSPFVKKTK